LAELVGDRLDPLDVVLVGEVRTEHAAPEVGLVGVDAVAPVAEDARPRRGQPRQVAAEALALLGRVVELDPGARRCQVGLAGVLLLVLLHGATLVGSATARSPPGSTVAPCVLASSTSDPTPSTCWWWTPITVPRRSRRRSTRWC